MAEPGTTVLIVEDDPDIREIAVTVLEADGYRIIEAANGDDAYRLLASRPDLRVDVLFTDIVMPGRRDGIDLASAAQQLRPELRVLYATGFANLVRADRDSAAQGPVLRKPYRPSELRRAILAVLDRVS
ncbi:MAG TPA: response regulator [Stellaceae bacterium]|nr:response regulator [Stellaceae bacterium]